MKSIALLLFASFIAACATVQVTPLNPPPAAMTPRGASEVEVYLTKAPDKAYDEVFLIRSDAADSEQALQAMRKRAGELGCDGIVITGNADRVVSAPDASGNATVSMREGFLGACIVFK